MDLVNSVPKLDQEAFEQMLNSNMKVNTLIDTNDKILISSGPVVVSNRSIKYS